MDKLTPIEFRRRTSSVHMLENPAERLAYQHTVFCQTCLPYRDPGESVRVWERRQGAVGLTLEAGRVWHPGAQMSVAVGLPYGSRPRLILAYLNRQALLSGTPRIEVEASLTAFVKRVAAQNSSPRGAEIRRFKDQLTRFAAATVRMAVDLSEDCAYQVNTQIIGGFELWCRKDERPRVFWPGVVELSAPYFESLTRHAVPLDERAIAALANSPMALDVYAWLAQRLCRIRPGRAQFVSWVSLKEQFGFGFGRMNNFKGAFRTILLEVKAQYRGAKFDLDREGIRLSYSLPPVHGRSLDLVKDE